MTQNSSKLRLVRCPKCDQLLPELPTYSVYLCGGCGAYLKAEKKPTLLELIDSSSFSWESTTSATAAAAAAESSTMPSTEGGADRRGRTPERRYNQESNPGVRVSSKSPMRSPRAEASTEESEFGGFANPRYKSSPVRSVRSGGGGNSRLSSPLRGSPVRSVRGGGGRTPSKSPVRRETTDGDGRLSTSSPARPVRVGGGFKVSPTRDNDADEYYAASHKSSPARSGRGGKSPMRDRVPTGHNSPSKSPARSVRSGGGLGKSPARSYHSPARSYHSPARLTTERDGARSPLRQSDLVNPVQMPADEKVGAWIDQQIIGKVKQDEEGEQSSDSRGSSMFHQKINSFGDWLDSDRQPPPPSVKKDPQQQTPPPGDSRPSSSPRNRRRWKVDEAPIPEMEEVYGYEPERQGDMYGGRRRPTEVPDDDVRDHRGGGGIQSTRYHRAEGRMVEDEVRYVERDQYERGARRRYEPPPPDMYYYDNPRNSYELELYRKYIELQTRVLVMEGLDPLPPPIRRGPPQRYGGPPDDYMYAEDPRARSPYQSHGHSRPAYNSRGRRRNNLQEFGPAYHQGGQETVQLDMPLYDDEDEDPRTPTRASAAVAAQYHHHPRQQPESDYVPRRFRDHPAAAYVPPVNQQPYEQYPLPREDKLHPPNCHCPRCQVSILHAHPHQQHRRSSSSQTEPGVIAAHHHHHPDPRDYNPRFSNSSPQMKPSAAVLVTTPSEDDGGHYNPRFSNSSPHMKPSSAVLVNTASEDSGGSTHHQHRRRRKSSTSLPKNKVCRPVAGAAPFVVCNHCSELLKLPKRVRTVKNSTVKCGSCSTTLELNLEVKMILRDPIPPQHKYHSGSVSSSTTTAKSQSKQRGSISRYNHTPPPLLDESVEGISVHQDSLAAGLSSESYTFDKYTFQSSESEPNLLLEELRQRKSNRQVAAEKQDHGDGSKELEQPPLNQNEAVAAAAFDQKRNTTTTPTPPFMMGNNLVRPPPGSPLREHMDYSNILKQGSVVDQGGGGEGISRQSAMESCSSDESEEGFAKGDDRITNSAALSRGNSTDTSGGKEDEVISEEMVSNGGGRVFPELKERHGFDSSSVSSSMTATATTGKADVFVNGQPISQRKVKNAESLAGPISRGDYWYDARAGFWGVMGGQCLGIIPPFINEFVFPMPVNCSKGNTSVYVNGRELHENDLEVLASRRLPRTKDKFYRIDITGRVEIENTGEFVCELGRLAPSVEKNRCGFGMSTPNT